MPATTNHTFTLDNPVLRDPNEFIRQSRPKNVRGKRTDLIFVGTRKARKTFVNSLKATRSIKNTIDGNLRKYTHILYLDPRPCNFHPLLALVDVGIKLSTRLKKGYKVSPVIESWKHLQLPIPTVSVVTTNRPAKMFSMEYTNPKVAMLPAFHGLQEAAVRMLESKNIH